MAETTKNTRRYFFATMVGVVAIYTYACLFGITWGLPSRNIDRVLFGTEAPWPGEKISRLAKAESKFAPNRGADVDVDPLNAKTNGPIDLTATEEDVARILLRYRLYTYQPDEMITMMALAGMKPHELQLDPRLYQYGGLFIYPVGALIKLCGILGLIDVRGDLVFYLDHPDEFAKFYLVARGYSAAWGLVGVFIVFLIARRFAGPWAGVLAALIFAMLPVVVCMSHEGKPHLPGAVLMHMAVWLSMRYLQPRAQTAPSKSVAEDKSLAPAEPSPTNRDFVLMCITCGAAVGMVLSSWPICVLIPLTAFLQRTRSFETDGQRTFPGNEPPTTSSFGRAFVETIIGAGIVVITYLLSNPYVAINALFNRDVLYSNLGNSLAMYEISRVSEGLRNVIKLTAEGSTWPVLVLGVVVAIVVVGRIIVRLIRKQPRDLQLFAPLLVASVIFFLQFVLIGAGKPGEYGRFGIFPNTALVIASASAAVRLLETRGRWLGLMTIPILVLLPMASGGLYAWNFHLDADHRGSRAQIGANLAGRATLAEEKFTLGLIAEPAPYCCPPLPFASMRVLLFPSRHIAGEYWENGGHIDTVLQVHDRYLGTFRDVIFTTSAIFITDVGQRTLRWRPEIPEEASRTSTPISWANKPIMVFRKPPVEHVNK